MAPSKRGHDATRSAPIYTVYPGEYQGNVNPGFQESYPHTPPPEYEDVINGRLTRQEQGQGLPPQPAGIVFIAPVSKYNRMQKTLGLVFSLLFLIIFVIVFIKSLNIN